VSDQPKTTVDECHFSETGFALWKRDKQGRAYCTCDPRGKPDGWICETTKPTPGEWLREQRPDAWHPSAEESFHNGRAMERNAEPLIQFGPTQPSEAAPAHLPTRRRSYG
jgi:hypothetical protein